ncbi:kinase-like domain-containing protein [Favolaschia claudopus]|uniref:Kinase-like domain-containing protein n=1 Tax=Favolaschia claudopus TaxID=2862362 RepID=A0AAW0DGR4_9AGAR
MSIFVYQCLLDHLVDIVFSNGNDTVLPSPPVLEQLRHRFKLDELLETYHMPPILALLRCQEPRTALLEIAQQLGLKYSPDVLSAVRLDEERIAAHITYIMDTPEANEEALALRRDEAQHFIDVLDQILSGHLAGMYRMYPLDISKTHRFMLKLSQLSDKLPHTIFIHSISDCDRFYRERGGFGEIYRASYRGRTVALKRLSTSLTADVDDQRKARLRFCQEVLIWRRLQHPFILPLLGIDRETFQPSLAMVSPWMEQGTALNHAKKNGPTVVEKLLFQVAQGLAYLHSMTVVHGDLRGSNILISDDMTARLTDFGLTVFADNHETANPSTTNRAGSIQWMAPELIDPGGFGCSRFLRTTASDAYAFACVCIELYTGLPPFAGLSDATALLQIIAGKRPSRPDELTSDMLWNVITQLWADSKEARPSIDSVVDSLEILCHTPRTPVEDPQISSMSIINQIEHIDTLLPPPTSTTLKLSVESNQTMSSYASTNSEFMAAHFPRRFFVVKCPSEVCLRPVSYYAHPTTYDLASESRSAVKSWVCGLYQPRISSS